MARKQGWTATLVGMLVGIVGASIFWMFSPYTHSDLLNKAGDDLKAGRLSAEVRSEVEPVPSQALGSRYQMVARGQDVFLVDLKEGMVWRYFHQTKEQGFSKEDEGFLPLGLYYAGKKHYRASEIELPAAGAGDQTATGTGEKQVQ